MSFAKELLKELKLEAAVTRKYLASVPFDQAEYQPHEKSEKLGRLAIHLAEIVDWWRAVITQEDLDFLGFKPAEIETTTCLLEYYDGLLETAERALLEAKDEDFDANWTMRYGDQVIFTLPKRQVVRLFCMNHFVHHRAQLGVYLRILNVPLPSTYGPSADDDDDVLLINPYPGIDS